MSFFKSLFQFIFNIYFLIVFFIVISFALIIFKIQYLFFKTKYESIYKYFLFKYIGTVTHLIAFISVEKKYHAVYNSEETYVVVGNHNTNIDIPINTSSCPREIDMKFLSKIENTKLPVLGPIVKAMCVIVDRKNENSRQMTFQLMQKELNKGYSIFLYPEGTRNKTDELLKIFYQGAFKLAIVHQLPIVVNTLVGTKKVNSPNKGLSLMPGKVISHWEEPISTKGLTKDDIPDLMEQVRSKMMERLTNN